MVAMAVRRLLVEVVAAKGLAAKDGPPDAPTSNAYCVVCSTGACCDLAKSCSVGRKEGLMKLVATILCAAGLRWTREEDEGEG